MMRYLALVLCIGFMIGCGSPRRERAEEEQAVEQEIQSDEPAEYKQPDGAFGAKDYANEAKEATDQNTKALEAAAEETAKENQEDPQ